MSEVGQIRLAKSAQGHAPCVVVEGSPGRWQAWIRVSPQPLPPALATLVARRLAQLYGADRASADWRHLGRLAGFTNRKRERRQADGLFPWVKLIYARSCLAPNGAPLLEAIPPLPPPAAMVSPVESPAGLYQTCLDRLRIRERYPAPDWSIADRWVARELLETGAAPALVAAVLRNGSPGFPRRHADPEDYLHRTVRSAALFSRAPHRRPPD